MFTAILVCVCVCIVVLNCYFILLTYCCHMKKNGNSLDIINPESQYESQLCCGIKMLFGP